MRKRNGGVTDNGRKGGRRRVNITENEEYSEGSGENIRGFLFLFNKYFGFYIFLSEEKGGYFFTLFKYFLSILSDYLIL